MADDIFWPTDHSSWPFSYQSIFDQAFAEYPAKRAADLCPRQLGKDDATLRIGRAIAPTAAQEPLLQKLGTALAQANGYLIKSCPAEIPPLPVERLQLMVSQIDAMTMALEIVRVPLQKFEQSLDDIQRALLSARMACAKNPEPANWLMPILKQALQPTAAQEAALNDLERAFNRAASELNFFPSRRCVSGAKTSLPICSHACQPMSMGMPRWWVIHCQRASRMPQRDIPRLFENK